MKAEEGKPSLPRQLMVGMGGAKEELEIGCLKVGQDSGRWLQEVRKEEFQDEGLWTEAMSKVACPSEAEPISTLEVMGVWRQQEMGRGRRKESCWGIAHPQIQ